MITSISPFLSPSPMKRVSLSFFFNIASILRSQPSSSFSSFSSSYRRRPFNLFSSPSAIYSLTSTFPRTIHTSSTSETVSHNTTAAKGSVPVCFVAPSGDRWFVMAPIGSTVLECARANSVPIIGDCEGGGAGEEMYGEGAECRDCHIYVDNNHVGKIAPKTEGEKEILYWIDATTKNSRLACELIVTEETAGATFVIPVGPKLKEYNY